MLLGDRNSLTNWANWRVRGWRIRQTEMYTKDRILPGPTKKWRIKRIDELNVDELDEFYCTV